MAGEILKAKQVLKIGQRMEFYLEGSEERYSSRVEDIQEDSLVVAMPLNKKRVPIIPHTRERLYGLAVGDRCRYRFFSTFKKTGNLEGRIPVWYITVPETVERHQNRRFVRVRANLPIRVRLIDKEGKIGKAVDTRMIDISGTGVSFVLSKEIPTGIQAGLEIDNIPGIGTLEVMCKVARCNRVMLDEEHSVYHVGVQFQHLSRSVTNRIVRYTFTVQREAIAKGITEP